MLLEDWLKWKQDHPHTPFLFNLFAPFLLYHYTTRQLKEHYLYTIAPHSCWLQQCQLTCSKLRILPLGEKSALISRAVSWSPISHRALMNFQCIFALSCCFLLYSSALKNTVSALSKESPKPTDHSEVEHDRGPPLQDIMTVLRLSPLLSLGRGCSLFPVTFPSVSRSRRLTGSLEARANPAGLAAFREWPQTVDPFHLLLPWGFRQRVQKGRN